MRVRLAQMRASLDSTTDHMIGKGELLGLILKV